MTEKLSDREVWSLVAAVWQGNTDARQLALGRENYAQNCAACHGVDGDGEGVFAGQMASSETANGELEGHSPRKPTDFTAAESMLGASPAGLAGTIIRGGMGSGMPCWGPLFTEEQIGALAAYLWTFQFDYHLEVKE